MEPKTLNTFVNHRPTLFLLLLNLVLFLAADGFCEPGFYDRPEGNTNETDLVSSLTTRELVAQTLMVGYQGVFPDDELIEFIEQTGVGGVKVFGWNTGDLVELARGIGVMQQAAANSAHGVPLFVATDQEGGWVRHVKGETTDTPGNLAIGASGLAVDAYETAKLIGRELIALGINMNFAPTVDVYLNLDSEIIGPRAFSADPVQTAFLSLAFYRGLEAVGVISTAKHFPGHGNTAADSHGTLPVIEDSIDTIWDRDLLPYRMLVPEGLPAIMSGHLSYPAITGESIPATLSETMLKGILRDRMGFSGIIITDDMRMYGVLQGGMQVAEACRLALVAGNDVIMISQDFETQMNVFDYLVETAEADPEFKHVLQRAVTRIIDTKQRYFGDLDPTELTPDRALITERIPDRQGREALLDLACRSVTVLRPFSVPLDPGLLEDEGAGILLVGPYQAFLDEGLRRYPRARRIKLPVSGATKTHLRMLDQQAARSDRIIYCLADTDGVEALEALSEYGDRVTVMSVLTPVHLETAQWVSSAIATFGRGVESFRAGFAVLAGDYEPEGILPIPMRSVRR